MKSSEIPSRFERVFRLPIGWHEYPAQRLEACGTPGLEDDSDDDPEAEPAERREMQQVCPMANRTRMATLNVAMTKPRPASTTTSSMAQTADGDQYRLVR